MKNKTIKLILKILLSAVFIGFLIVKVDWGESWQYLRKIEIWQVIAYLAVIFLGLFISTRKWQKLCLHKGLKDSFLNFFKLYLTGAFINNFVPSTIGGDIFRAYQIGKKEKKYSEASSTVVADRFTGLLALMLMSPIFFILNFQKASGIYFITVANLIILGLLIGLTIFFKTRKTAFAKKILGYLPDKAVNFLRELSSFGKNKKIFFESLAYSFLFNLIGVGLANLVLFWSLGININIWDYFSVIFLISIVSSIPAGVGLKEWAYAAFFVPLGINISAVVMVAILNRFLQGLANITAFPIYLKGKRDFGKWIRIKK
ncbi:MAG: lysylphosphatidylglycerol synthase transmembrane domain-containing protein [Parcubacteria group bacterium]